MDDDDILDIMRDALNRSRHYADYWEWDTDPKRAELGVAEKLIEFLGIDGRFDTHERESPDLLFLASDGRKIGIEVTELVDGRAAGHNRHAQRKGKPHVEALWNEASVAEEISRRLAIKDQKVAKSAADFDEIWMALATDEPTIDMAMAEKSCAACVIDAACLQRAFLLLGYHPAALSRFPNGCAVFPISIA
jgi:hypothetical protein